MNAGWRCFFCGELFLTVSDASQHFGTAALSTTACQKLQRRIWTLNREIEDVARRAEERGYRRGVQDAEAGRTERSVTDNGREGGRAAVIRT